MLPLLLLKGYRISFMLLLCWLATILLLFGDMFSKVIVVADGPLFVMMYGDALDAGACIDAAESRSTEGMHCAAAS